MLSRHWPGETTRKFRSTYQVFGLLFEIETFRAGRQPLNRKTRRHWNSSRPLLEMESVTNNVLVAVNFILSVKIKFNRKFFQFSRFLRGNFSYRKNIFIWSMTSEHWPRWTHRVLFYRGIVLMFSENRKKGTFIRSCSKLLVEYVTFYFILFYFILFYFILFYFLFYFMYIYCRL
jgi:hypothetical protein